MENHKATKLPAFNVGPPFKWCFSGVPMMAHFLWYMDPISPHQLKKKNKILNKNIKVKLGFL